MPDGFTPVQFLKLKSKYDSFVDRMDIMDLDKSRVNVVSKEFIEKVGIPIKTPTKEAFDTNMTGTPMDSRLGTLSRDSVCKTCCQTSATCVGHIGYIPLKHKIINPFYYGYLIQVLKSVCHECGSLIANEDLIFGSFMARLEKSAEIGSAKRKCRDCGSINKIVVSNINGIMHSPDPIIEHVPSVKNAPMSEERNLSMNNLQSILGRIKPSALKTIGFNTTHPSSFVMSYIIVTSIQSRPNMFMNGRTSQNTFTAMYDKIIMLNRDSSSDSKPLTPAPGTNTKWRKFQYSPRTDLFRHIWGMMNKTANIKIDGFRNINEMIKGKGGLIRGNIMGKRGNQCCRTVLGPSSTSVVGEMSFPNRGAKIATTPHVLTRYNIRFFREKWKEGKIFSMSPGNPNHPLYKSIVHASKELIEKYKLYVGDIIHKNIESGDIITFNRQPSLHRNSLLGTRALVEANNPLTNRIHSSATEPANADFDGDEGNVWIHQSLESMAEQTLVCNIRQHIITSSYGSPQISLQYHGPMGLYMMTKDYTFDLEDWEDGISMFGKNRASYLHGNQDEQEEDELPIRHMERKTPLGHTGRDMFSILLPNSFNYKRGDVVIRDGNMISGILVKKHVGSSNGSIVHAIALKYGDERAADFVSSAQKMSNWFLSIRPLTITLVDCIAMNEDNRALATYIRNKLDVKKEVTENDVMEVNVAYRGCCSDTNDKWCKFISENREEMRLREREFGLDDCFKPSAEKYIQSLKQEMELGISQIMTAGDGKIMTEEEKESKILNILNKTDRVGNDMALKYMKDTNPLTIMRVSAKGSVGNTAQIVGAIGQIVITNERPNYSIAKTRQHPQGTKVSPYYMSLEDEDKGVDIEERGFVMQSYTKGIKLSHIFHTLNNAREGLMTSKLSTADTGYFFRTLVRTFEDVLYGHDGSVMYTHGGIISFSLLDGFDASKTIMVDGTYHFMDLQSLADDLSSSV